MAKMKPFVEFSFNGISCAKYHLIRVSDGSRYNDNMGITITDTTATVPGQSGTMLFNSQYKQRTFAIQVAFDSVTEEDLRNIRNWLNGTNIGDLVFGEDEDRIFSAKVQNAPTFKYICFDKPDGKRVYKGEGTINFIAYYPYAHSKDQVTYTSGQVTIEGTADTTFIYTESSVAKGQTITVNYRKGDDSKQIEIVAQQYCGYLEWNSRTGMTVDLNDNRVPVPFVGDVMASIPAGATITSISSGGTLQFYNWYY